MALTWNEFIEATQKNQKAELMTAIENTHINLEKEQANFFAHIEKLDNSRKSFSLAEKEFNQKHALSIKPGYKEEKENLHQWELALQEKSAFTHKIQANIQSKKSELKKLEQDLQNFDTNFSQQDFSALRAEFETTFFSPISKTIKEIKRILQHKDIQKNSKNVFANLIELANLMKNLSDTNQKKLEFFSAIHDLIKTHAKDFLHVVTDNDLLKNTDLVALFAQAEFAIKQKSKCNYGSFFASTGLVATGVFGALGYVYRRINSLYIAYTADEPEYYATGYYLLQMLEAQITPSNLFAAASVVNLLAIGIDTFTTLYGIEKVVDWYYSRPSSTQSEIILENQKAEEAPALQR